MTWAPGQYLAATILGKSQSVLNIKTLIVIDVTHQLISVILQDEPEPCLLSKLQSIYRNVPSECRFICQVQTALEIEYLDLYCIMIFKNITPALMAFTGVTNPHRPSTHSTACRSPTCSLKTATGSYRAKGKVLKPSLFKKSGVNGEATIRCQHILVSCFISTLHDDIVQLFSPPVITF